MENRSLDLMSVEELTSLFLEFTKKAFDAVEKALPSINEVINLVINAIKSGGRVFYVGAGTSGRIGVLDASEIEPTFSVNGLFIPIMAGGIDALLKPKEDLEDNEELGKSDLESYRVKENDIVIGISASGKTPYVLGALKYAHLLNVKTILIANNKVSYPFIDVIVFLDTSEEFILGSSRLTAGTSQKIVLNMISTISMVKLGYTYGNLMVAVKPTNSKLVNRAASIVSLITGAPYEQAFELVKEVKDARIASIMIKKNVSKEEAEQILKEHNFNFRSAYES